MGLRTVVFNAADWPTQDQVPDTSLSCFSSFFLVVLIALVGTPEVQEWLTELDGFYIPDINPTADGSCAGDPAAAAQAALNGWWTCGGYTRPTGEFTLYFFSPQVHDIILPDITACPDKMTWGVR